MPCEQLGVDEGLFELLLDIAAERLTEEAQAARFISSKSFENRVREISQELGKEIGVAVEQDTHPYAFPDISLGNFGIEVKFTTNDTWRCVTALQPNGWVLSFRSGRRCCTAMRDRRK